MKKIFWLAGGLCAAAAGFLAWGARTSRPVEDLAHRGEDPMAEDMNFDEAKPDESYPDAATQA